MYISITGFHLFLFVIVSLLIGLVIGFILGKRH